MKLVERFRRWWNPAQWRDDHPGEDDEQSDAPPTPRRSAFGSVHDYLDHGGRVDGVDVVRDLKRPSTSSGE